jgi:hypothetical protein
MERFRTTINAGVSKSTLTLTTPVLTLGSCFADAIGHRLVQSKFPALVNPLGTLYSPMAVVKGLQYVLSEAAPAPHTFIQNQDIYLNYDFHSSFSSPDLPVLQQKISDTLGSTRNFLKTAQWLMITWGTAWVHERTDTRELVANCHKMPARLFTKHLLEVEQITHAFAGCHAQLRAFNPKLRILLTVSPVRHTKETLEGNSVSKSILRVACDVLARKLDDVSYFPAYEIMMDDLRDYRFYKDDMIHPTALAEDYIWERFIDGYADAPTRRFIGEWATLRAALAHKPFHPASTAHQEFLRQTLEKLEALKHSAPVDVDHEIQSVRTQLQPATKR